MGINSGTTRYFDAEETLAQPQRLGRQGRALARMATLGYRNSEAVRRIFDERSLDPAGLAAVKDLESLPVISREQLVRLQQKERPYGGLCGLNARIDRIFISPGPVYEPHLSESDTLWARGYHAAGFGPSDVVLNTFSYHMVAAGITFHEGLRKVGATVIPSGTSSTDQQVQLIRDLQVTGYAGTPSFLMAIIKKAEQSGYDFKRDFSLRKAVFVAEPLQPSLRMTLEQEYGIDTYQMYGATEVGDIAYECSEKRHWHVCEEVIVEIVDPATGKQVEPGEMGEVVVTRLNETFFLFRFGTGDLSSLITEPCPCGRTSYSLSGIAGRVGESAKVRGMFITPSQMERVSTKMNGLSFKVVIDRHDFRDRVSVVLEPPETAVNGDALAIEFADAFHQECTIKADKIVLLKSGTLDTSSTIIEDRRNWQ
jgi:phenylacetate-CoA ligase